MANSSLDFYADVETDGFAARTHIASTLSQFEEAVRADPAYKRLLTLLRDEPEAESAVTKRVARLSERAIDPTYAHPFDAALSAYVMALGDRKSAVVGIAATLALQAAQTWWTRQMCLNLLRAGIESRMQPFFAVVADSTPFAQIANTYAVDLSESAFRYQQLWTLFGNVLSSAISTKTEWTPYSAANTARGVTNLGGPESSVPVEDTTTKEESYKAD